MQDRGTFLRVGLFVVFGIAALVGLVIFFSGDAIRSGKNFETYIRESVQGLDVGAPVKFRGVTLGRVTEIGLVRATYGKDAPDPGNSQAYAMVLVRFRMDTAKIGVKIPFDEAIRNGLRARLASQGITGVSYIELDFEPPKAYPPLAVPWEPRDTYIPSMPSTLTRVQDAGQQLLQKLNDVDIVALVAGLNKLVGDLRETLNRGDVHALLTNSTATLNAIQDAVRAANLAALSEQAQQALKAANNAANGQQTRDLISNANQAVEKLSAAITQLQPLIVSLQATAQRADNGSADLLRSLGPMLRDLQATVSNLRDASTQLRRDPGQTLFGKPPPRDPEFGR